MFIHFNLCQMPMADSEQVQQDTRLAMQHGMSVKVKQKHTADCRN